MIAVTVKARRITCILLHVSTTVTAVKSTNDELIHTSRSDRQKLAFSANEC